MEISPALFDEWSVAWHANKVRRPNCNVVYRCIAQTTDGKPCEKAVSAKAGGSTCWNHRSYKNRMKGSALLVLPHPK